MSIPSNLPVNTTTTDSSTPVRNYFDAYFVSEISFPSEEIDAVNGFFRKRGFDELASNTTGIVLLQQAKIDNVNVFTLLDTLKGLTDVQLSAVVTEVLNYNRQKNSVLGYRQEDTAEYLEKRNIVA